MIDLSILTTEALRGEYNRLKQEIEAARLSQDAVCEEVLRRVDLDR